MTMTIVYNFHTGHHTFSWHIVLTVNVSAYGAMMRWKWSSPMEKFSERKTIKKRNNGSFVSFSTDRKLTTAGHVYSKMVQSAGICFSKKTKDKRLVNLKFTLDIKHTISIQIEGQWKWVMFVVTISEQSKSSLIGYVWTHIKHGNGIFHEKYLNQVERNGSLVIAFILVMFIFVLIT